ncbi:hypothetical protein [Novosphingopyxis sp.]|uniref:hypothetical protein n=1 Tax=Novosphingopyxis sp. TaxID=2709690 RepID=UPI003B5C0FD7
MPLVERFLAERRHRDRHVLQALRLALRGDDDIVVEQRCFRRRVLRHLVGDAAGIVSRNLDRGGHGGERADGAGGKQQRLTHEIFLSDIFPPRFGAAAGYPVCTSVHPIAGAIVQRRYSSRTGKRKMTSRLLRKRHVVGHFHS